MKNLFLTLGLILSYDAFSATQTYRINSGLCGEMDPFAVGDACVLELSNEKKEHFYIITDFDLPMIEGVNSEELDRYKIRLDKGDLTRATKSEREALDRVIMPGKPVFRIEAQYLDLF